uniref:Uncharacterized protein n=1 Tax=Anopheles dirus TaxID=7168 RepID=A0A182NQU4_9DIPT
MPSVCELLSTMVHQKNQISIRIVSVDYYMSKPDPQFDACYSEFRGSEVKQVPVIRLFGSSAEGTHSCVHIHGVFPYFYVPYDESTTDRLAVDQKIYQLANALDKAINVSLAKSMSQTKHIFKIVLVKGVPIYGYHRNAHHYLKIYMYNPMLVRKATQLLMNGTILSKNYQVHETHVPYILQFFIDYNLYGMSFLDLDSKGLRQRKSIAETGNNDPPKMSTSEYEIDVLAANILNREPEEEDNGEFANPGIASIWKDEQARRMLLGLEQPERMNLSQDTGIAGSEVVTESDRFYRALLVSKLLQKPTVSSSVEERRKVPTSAYPSEAVEGATLLDASYIANHMRDSAGRSNESLYDSQLSYHFDASTMIDEDKIVSLSQNPDATLVEDDYNMIEIMRELEEQETKNFEGDCLLAPLTQQSGESNRSIIQANLNVSQANRLLNASLCGNLETVCLMSEQAERRTGKPEDASFDSDDEFLLDFTQKQADANALPDVAERYFSDSDDELLLDGCIPQLDGGDDSFTPMSSKRHRDSKEREAQLNSSAKRVRFDLTQPTVKKSVTPRRVTFAPSPPEKEHARAKRVLQEFENSSPNTLKNFEIRVSKLGFIKRINEHRSEPSNVDEFPIKPLQVRVTRLDCTAYDMHEFSAKKISYDRYQQARDYDMLNNYDPMEGPSTPKMECVRKKSPKKGRKGLPTSKRQRLEFEEEQQIEVILSERFKNIVRLSPKVLIKSLLLIENATANSELSLSNYSPSGEENSRVNEDQSAGASIASKQLPSSPTDSTKQGESGSKSPENASTADKQQPAVEDCTLIEDSDDSEKYNDGMDVEFSLPTSSETDENTQDNAQCIAVDDSSSDDGEPLKKKDKAPKTNSTSEKEIVTIADEEANDVRMISPSIFDTIPLSELLDKDLANTIDLSEDDKTPTFGGSPAVSIGSQLDGVVELMDTSGDKAKKDEKDDASNDAAEEAEPEEETPANIQSFCENTLLCELDDINSDSDDSCLGGTWNRTTEGNEEGEKHVVVLLQAKAPTREEALRAIETLEIPPVVNPTPFYSDPADVSGKKEIGHTVLNIAGNSLNDAEEFTSTIAGLTSLKHLRYDNLQRTFGESIGEVLGPVGSSGPNSDRIKELLASEGSVVITPSDLPPNRADASSWLDNRCRKRHAETATAADQDSPVKVKTAGTIMTLADDKVEASHPVPAAPKIDKNTNGSNEEAAKQNKSPEDTINSSAVIDSSMQENTTDNTASSKEQTTKQPQHLNLTEEENVVPAADFEPSDQSDRTNLEQSNANISTATPIDNTFGFKVNYENLQDAKSKCEIRLF